MGTHPTFTPPDWWLASQLLEVGVVFPESNGCVHIEAVRLCLCMPMASKGTCLGTLATSLSAPTPNLCQLAMRFYSMLRGLCQSCEVLLHACDVTHWCLGECGMFPPGFCLSLNALALFTMKRERPGPLLRWCFAESMKWATIVEFFPRLISIICELRSEAEQQASSLEGWTLCSETGRQAQVNSAYLLGSLGVESWCQGAGYTVSRHRLGICSG